MTNIENRLTNISSRIALAAERSGRNVDEISLLAVSKAQSEHDMRALYRLGIKQFGESYLQEALPKINALKDCDIQWHFIGPIQSNKTQSIALHFDWVHSVDRLKIATRLHEQRPVQLPPLNVCLQINISAEGSKSGISPQDVDSMLEDVQALSRLKVRGLMAIPAYTDDEQEQRAAFGNLCSLFEQSRTRYPSLDTLSMGMTEDFEAAILEGATIIRVGSGLFGGRD